jgi:hypothetical protein
MGGLLGFACFFQRLKSLDSVQVKKSIIHINGALPTN